MPDRAEPGSASPAAVAAHATGLDAVATRKLVTGASFLHLDRRDLVKRSDYARRVTAGYAARFMRFL